MFYMDNEYSQRVFEETMSEMLAEGKTLGQALERANYDAWLADIRMPVLPARTELVLPRKQQ